LQVSGKDKFQVLKTANNRFGKAEKLCGELDIDRLYKQGTSFLSHPVVFYYIPQPDLLKSQVLVSVSKKKFKNAVDRNLIKRRLREAYRLNKSILQHAHHIGMVYVGNSILEYNLIRKSVVEGLAKIETTSTAPSN